MYLENKMSGSETMKKITLNKTNLTDLADLSIGKRVRYIREHLQSECDIPFLKNEESIADWLKEKEEKGNQFIQRMADVVL